MSENLSKQKILSLSKEQVISYNKALQRVMAYQNRDGSWGKTEEEKVTLTAQTLQLMLSLGIKRSEPVFVKAARWIEDKVDKGSMHWVTRIEIGLKVGDFEKLLEEGWIKDFIDELNHDLNNPESEAHLNFFWHVIPTLIELEPHKKELEDKGIIIPYDQLIDRVISYCQVFNEECIVVQHQPNHTGLVAVWLNCIAVHHKEAEKLRHAMIKWLVQTRLEDDKGVYWMDSKSVTSYVIIDLLKCLPQNEVDDYLSKAVKYLCPNNRGIVHGDKNTTYNTKLHAESLYATILVLRAIAEISNEMAKISNDVSEGSKLKDSYDIVKSKRHMFIYYKFTRFLSGSKRKIPIIISVLLLSGGIIAYCYKANEIGSLLVSTSVAAALGLFFDWLMKPNT